MARIRRAQEKGKTDVRLSKEELEAFERRRQREEEEERRKRREQRIAIPLSQFNLGPRKRNSVREDSPPRRHSPEPIAAQQPPMGYFPPSSSRSLRPPAAAGSSSRTPSRVAAERERTERGDSPFTYSYVNPAEHSMSSTRHASDPATTRPLPRTSPRADTASPPSRHDISQGPVDVFQYMTGGESAPYHTGDRRRSGTVSGGETDSDSDYVPPAEKRVSSSGSGTRGRLREEYAAAEERPRQEPERRPTRDRTPPPSSSSKKSSALQSPVRRKSVVSGSSSLKSKRKVK
ncbi:hypothetical protein B0T14DRAFT_559994 [Immersiella caudata]|uniref:Uncharacterized protein n=1 Tax=Immersiella caudata TaxID=314043 RepID=A0AA40CB57_9PEZI|nr:hypothetical protein B0T14DRAFT_559994 [Immersiella caudata]